MPCHRLRKVLDLGCNAVLAYQQDFDVEGDSGIVARAYGTACVIQRREPDRTEHPLTRQVCLFGQQCLRVASGSIDAMVDTGPH